MSPVPNQDEGSQSCPQVDTLDQKEEPDQDSMKVVELGDELGQEEPLDYNDTSVEELVEKWKQRSEERDCQYASIGLQSEKILAELCSISEQIKQIQMRSNEEAADNQAAGDQRDGNQGEIDQGNGDQDNTEPQDDENKENSNRVNADQGYYQWDADQFFVYQGDAGQGSAGQGDSNQDDADTAPSSVSPAYFTF
ncbi:uncharacterized protein [Drosophila pseudoobscura]|uniref:Uncharacterized protein n=1 Tax=Drosophila pseudoobscura pseudoobscura TaxID=46245 RepID=A0A6I8VIK9_DROPS|nr:uncharacterized protein LOC6901812 [Drosophila pseudoobscura]XP_015042145.2 uncharacterized protein LOC6901812 [Drosophila pseudoobscura]XP_015042146.2 uncharacterized protein LOC6901812 [Drosophila pseudoobscura]